MSSLRSGTHRPPSHFACRRPSVRSRVLINRDHASQSICPWLSRLHRVCTCAAVCAAALQSVQANAFKGVETEKKEKALMRSMMPTLETRVAELGEGHRVVTVNALDAVVRLLQEHKEVRDEMIAKSERWKMGDCWKMTEPPEKIDEMDCGSVMRLHPHLMRPAGPGEERDLRVGAILYADEVETVDTGYAKSTHKLLTIQLTFANLSTKLRFDHEVIQLLGLARHPAVSKWGQAGVFAGALCSTVCNTVCSTVCNTCVDAPF